MTRTDTSPNRADSTPRVITVPGGDPTGGDPRVVGTETPQADATPVDGRDTSTRPRAQVPANRTNGLNQPTTRGATQPDVAGTPPQTQVDPANPAAATTPAAAETTEKPGFLAKAGETLTNIGNHLESDTARLATTAVGLGAACTIPVVGNIIAIGRGALHLLGFLGSCLKGKPNFTQLLQAGVEIGLGSLFMAPMAAPAGLLIGEMGVPKLLGDNTSQRDAPSFSGLSDRNQTAPAR